MPKLSFYSTRPVGFVKFDPARTGCGDEASRAPPDGQPRAVLSGVHGSSLKHTQARLRSAWVGSDTFSKPWSFLCSAVTTRAAS